MTLKVAAFLESIPPSGAPYSFVLYALHLHSRGFALDPALVNGMTSQIKERFRVVGIDLLDEPVQGKRDAGREYIVAFSVPSGERARATLLAHQLNEELQVAKLELNKG